MSLAVFAVPPGIITQRALVFGGNPSPPMVRRPKVQRRRWLFLRCFPLFFARIGCGRRESVPTKLSPRLATLLKPDSKLTRNIRRYSSFPRKRESRAARLRGLPWTRAFALGHA